MNPNSIREEKDYKEENLSEDNKKEDEMAKKSGTRKKRKSRPSIKKVIKRKTRRRTSWSIWR